MIFIEISTLGKNSLQDVSEFLLFLWNIDTLQKFINIIDTSSKKLQKNPLLGKPYSNNTRKIILHKNASMFYEFNEEKQKITILLFIDNRQNPKDYLKLL